MINKKVRNATVVEYSGIKFKSKMEVSVYKTLIANGFKPEYESKKFVLVKGFKPTVQFYIPNKNKELMCVTKKVIDVTYTPDFIIYVDEVLIVIEVKGQPNDIYPLKRKLFVKYMEESNVPMMFFEIHNMKQLYKVIETIKKI